MENIIDKIINSELCVGCGACTTSSKVEMKWNRMGFLEPRTTSNLYAKAHKFCPFNIEPDTEVQTEDELSNNFLEEAPNVNDKMGRFYNTYVGYAFQFRKTSSSGGVATYILSKLLEQDIVDYIVSVGEGETNHYDYCISSTQSELLKTSKTKYYPVSMSAVLKHIEANNGRYAIVGTACFIKSVRLLQYYNPIFKERIKFTVGIICGGQKSKFYTDFLASKLNLPNGYFTKPEFRIKDVNSTAIDYSFGCLDENNKIHSVKMSVFGDMWGTGLFKNKACDFCDDVTSELADISLGDAWLSPYYKEGEGTNVIVTRTKLANELIKNGVTDEELDIEELSVDAFLSSQQGSFNHRHIGLAHRVLKVKKKGVIVPPKRFSKKNEASLIFKFVQNQRMKVRKNSLDYWIEYSKEDFSTKLSKDLNLLKLLTKIYHRVR